MNYYFHPAAKKELVDAVKYYNECGSGLGYIFMDEVETTIRRIMQHPKAWSKISKNAQRCLTRRFPYGIIYQEVERDVIIIAVMHLKREPEYWISRVEVK